MKKCCICCAEVSADADILAISAYGSERLLCPDCAKLLDTSLTSKDFEEIAAASDELAAKIERFSCDDELVLSELEKHFKSARERADMIRAGSYDFTLDEKPDEADESEPLHFEPEPELTEKELAEKAKKERIGKIFDTVFTVACGTIITAFVIFFIIRLF